MSDIGGLLPIALRYEVGLHYSPYAIPPFSNERRQGS